MKASEQGREVPGIGTVKWKLLTNQSRFYEVNINFTGSDMGNWRDRFWRNRMREIRSYGSVGEQGGNELLYPESPLLAIPAKR